MGKAVSDLWKCGLGLIQVEILEQEGYHCLADLAAATDEQLLAIPGMGPFKLRWIRRAAPFVPLTTGPHASSALSAGVATPYRVEELPDDLRSLPDTAASGRQHQDG